MTKLGSLERADRPHPTRASIPTVDRGDHTSIFDDHRRRPRGHLDDCATDAAGDSRGAMPASLVRWTVVLGMLGSGSEPQLPDGVGLSIGVEVGDIDDVVDREGAGSVKEVEIVELVLGEMDRT